MTRWQSHMTLTVSVKKQIKAEVDVKQAGPSGSGGRRGDKASVTSVIVLVELLPPFCPLLLGEVRTRAGDASGDD